MSVRQDIVDEIVSGLQLIQVEEGGVYTTDIGSKVQDWRLDPISIDDMPCVVVKVPGSKVDVESRPVAHVHNLSIEVYVYCADKFDTQATLINYMSDIMLAMRDVEIALQGLGVGCQYLIPVDNSFEIFQDDKIYAEGKMMFEVGYTVERFGF